MSEPKKIKANFIIWLQHNQINQCIPTLKINYDISLIDFLLKKQGEIDSSIFLINDSETIEKVIKRLKAGKIIHSPQLRVLAIEYIAAFRKYTQGIQVVEQTHEGNNDKAKKDDFMDTRVCKNLLDRKFKHGFRLHSKIDMNKFKRYYQEESGIGLVAEDCCIEAYIKKCGIEYEGKVYLPEDMLSDELRRKVFFYIDKQLEEGAKRVYFEAIFQKFSDDFLDYDIYDADMLQAYISYYADNQYIIARDYISKEILEDSEPIDDIRKLLKENVFPMEFSDICQALPYIPGNKIKEILSSNREFVRNSKGVYFHADSFDITKKELISVINIINMEIEKNSFITGNELYNDLKRTNPSLYERNNYFSDIGWRDALKYKLSDKFSFNGNVISKHDEHLSMRQVFSNYGRCRRNFTLSALLQLKDHIGSRVIYFSALYEHAIRVSEDYFVNKDEVSFQVEKTDCVLDKFCPGQFIPLMEISNFGIFPDASYPWNEYLLEGYLAFYSRRYRLLHTTYNQKSVVGAMVKRSSGINDFDGLITKAIANSEVPLQKQEILNYLYNKGYIGRRTYSGIEKILINARAIRNRKEK